MEGRPVLEDVIEHYTGQRPSKRMIQCPLHSDMTPSCSVNYVRQLWNCHSCGEGGDSWNLIMLKEQASFKTAVELADKYGFGDTEGAGQERGNRFTGTRRITARDRSGKKKTYRPRFARGG